MATRHLRFECGSIDRQTLRVDRSRIRKRRLRRLRTLRAQPGKCLFVRFENRGLGTQFCRVIAQRHTVVDTHGGDRRTDVFNRPVVQTFGTEATQHRQRDVLGPDAGTEGSCQLNPHRFRHAKPEFATHHHG